MLGEKEKREKERKRKCANSLSFLPYSGVYGKLKIKKL